jgi:hypothetical protein
MLSIAMLNVANNPLSCFIMPNVVILSVVASTKTGLDSN